MNINFFEFQIFSLIIILQIFYQINIYDISLNKLNQIIEFSGEEEISEEKFSKIVIKYNYEYILSIINDKILIFNNEGKLLYKNEEKINNNQIIYSYSLTLLNATKNNCDYILGYLTKIAI